MDSYEPEGVAASTRVGNLIGARSAVMARRAAHAAALLSVIVGTVVMVIMIATKDVSTSQNLIRFVIRSACKGLRIHLQ